MQAQLVTISHQTGAGAREIAARLAELLQETGLPARQPWTVLDRLLVERALEEHHWPWVLVPQVVETMLRLADAGRVILSGRGSTVAKAQLPNVYHVRIAAPLATRIKRL